MILPSYGAAVYVPTLVLERPLFFREYADGCYHVISYIMSKFIEEVRTDPANPFTHTQRTSITTPSAQLTKVPHLKPRPL